MVITLPVDTRREGRLDYLPQGGEIVAGNPTKELEHLSIEQRCVVEAIDNRFDIFVLGTRGELGDNLQQVACNLSASKRDDDPLADLAQGLQLPGDGIVKGLIHGEGDRYFCISPLFFLRLR
jgi:hypothetical protein